MILVTDCICGGTFGPIIGPPHPWLVDDHCPIQGPHINNPKEWCDTCQNRKPTRSVSW